MYIYRSDEALPTTSQFYNSASYDLAVALGSTNHYPFLGNMPGATVKIDAQLGITQMPIPTQNTPFLLNFTGNLISITLNWISVTKTDVAFLIQYFNSANPSMTVVVDLTDLWGGTSSTNNIITQKYNLGNNIPSGSGVGALRFNGVVSTLDIQQDAGEIMWRINMTLMVGLIVG